MSYIVLLRYSYSGMDRHVVGGGGVRENAVALADAVYASIATLPEKFFILVYHLFITGVHICHQMELHKLDIHVLIYENVLQYTEYTSMGCH
jgi:hypothetical protein